MSCKLGCRAGFGVMSPYEGGCSAAFGIKKMNIKLISPSELKKLTLAARRKRCRSFGKVYNVKRGRCLVDRRLKRGRKATVPKRAMTLAQKRAKARSMGMVYDPVTRRYRKSKKKTSKRKTSKFGCGMMPAEFGRYEEEYDDEYDDDFEGDFGKVSLARRRARCAAKSMRYNLKYKRCVPRKTRKTRKTGKKRTKGRKKMTLAQKKIKYGKRGLVYDPVTKRFRKSRKGKKAKFGEMFDETDYDIDFEGDFGKVSLAKRRARCAAKNMRYNLKYKRCVPRRHARHARHARHVRLVRKEPRDARR